MKAEFTAIIEPAPEGVLGHVPRDSRRQRARGNTGGGKG